MKVKDLKKVLDQLDPELNIVVDGYEGGLDDLLPQNIGVMQIIKNYSDNKYCGKHAPANSCYLHEDKKQELNLALILSRRNIDNCFEIGERLE